MKKKILSLALALVMMLALAVPAFAYETKSFALEDIKFTAAPVGIAKIQRQTEDWGVSFENVYVFDRYCMAYLKDGREFTYYSWAEVTGGLGDSDGMRDQVFQFYADGPGVYSVGIRTIGEDDEFQTEVCNMTSKAFLDTMIAEAEDIEGLTVEYQPMDEHIILQVPTANESSLVVRGMAAVETMQYEGESVSVYSLPTTGIVDFYPVGPVHSVTVTTAVVQDGTLALKEGEAPATWEYTMEEAWNVYFAPDGTEDPNEVAIIEYKDNGELVATIGLRLASAGEQPAAPAQAGTYTAKQWDTWGELALNNYGTYAVWPALMKANGNKAVSVGMTITLPEKIGSYSLLPAQVLAEGETLYTVKGGDTLGQIALATYGDMSLYKIIYERNKDRLTSPTMIYGGQRLVLPVKPAAQAPAQPEPPAEGQPVSFAKGDKVTVREGAKTYTGGNLAGFVYRNTYTVIAVNGDRVVIGVNGVATAAMNAADLISAK